MWHRSQWSRCGADRWVMQSLSLVWDVCFRKIVFFLVKSCGVIIDQDLLAQAINSRPKGFVKNNHNRYNHNSLLFCQRLPQTVVSSIFSFSSTSSPGWQGCIASICSLLVSSILSSNLGLWLTVHRFFLDLFVHKLQILALPCKINPFSIVQVSFYHSYPAQT